MPPPITSGLLWSTDVAIDFATSGPAVPAIPLARAAGPLYVVIAYHQAVNSGGTAVFYIGNPTDSIHEPGIFYGHRSYPEGFAVSTQPGRGQVGDLPTPPSDFVGEMWASTTDSNIISHGTPRWWFDPIPDHNPVATSHLFIGYKPNDGDPFWRGAGQIKRMAVYDRIPTPAERAELVEWVQSEDAPGSTYDRNAAIAATSDVTAGARLQASVSAVFAPASAVAAVGRLTGHASAEIAAASTVSAAGSRTRASAASATAQSSVAAGPRRIRQAAAGIASTSSVGAVSHRTLSASAQITATSTVAADGERGRQFDASATVEAGSSVTAAPVLISVGSADIVATSSLRAGGGNTLHASASVAASSGLTAAPQRIIRRAASAGATSSVSARPGAIRPSRTAVLSASTVAARPWLIRIAHAEFVAVSALIARPFDPDFRPRVAFPGDPQGGTLSPSMRGGVLAPSIRSGTITRP